MDPTIDGFLGQLDHPLKRELEAILELIRQADPSIREGIKWNAPSFRTVCYFATAHLRDPKVVQIILHLDAKTRPDVTGRLPIDDPHQLLQWLGPGRAAVKFRTQAEIEMHGSAFQAIVRQWITHLR